MDDQTVSETRVLRTFRSEGFEVDVVQEQGLDCPLVAVRFFDRDEETSRTITFCTCHVRELRDLLCAATEYVDHMTEE